MIRFYRAIGLTPVKQFTHDDLLHVQLRAPGFDLWILEGNADKALKRESGGEKRAVLLDPDGRAVDLTQRVGRAPRKA